MAALNHLIYHVLTIVYDDADADALSSMSASPQHPGVEDALHSAIKIKSTERH